ncbi:glycosyltransferase [Dysgonomonas sp. 216]|uniref:glycosyltransferase family 4 protein n=1 Tax=Dysgonomonas sp. 216 TaxID=2302934 RepID=UPI0013D68B76|nr:glycosyltransferase family 4 protein [Dysgonomonas sp. 216]NDW18234.1 glycosyltransferase [Dysgonomonas sp. 216]
MKIAFCSPVPLTKKLGATKNRLEFGEALQALGWDVFFIKNEMLNLSSAPISKNSYSVALKDYLLEHAKNFDIIIYEYDTLPFDRSLFAQSTLFVARPALLHYHFKKIKIPVSFKQRLADIKNSLKTFFVDNNKKSDKYSHLSLLNCDVIQVQNSEDYKLLSQLYPSKKIIIVPNGIAKDRFGAFQAIKRDYDNIEEAPKIAFVGTLEFRKGAIDFIYIIKRVVKEYPNAVFSIIGAKGLFTTTDAVLKFFPRKLRKNINVILNFEPNDLPSILSGFHIGIFPSYLESFGFGALEMMCAGLPVVAYKSPGPSDFIHPDLLVENGNKEQLTNKLFELIQNKDYLLKMSEESKQIVDQYRWEDIVIETSSVYLDLLKDKRK